MKRTTLLLLFLTVIVFARAQWTDDHENNTKIANSSTDAGEIYIATNENTGDTYLQWCAFGGNGWSPFLQRLNQNGESQWGEDGIHLDALEFSSYSQGISMVTTADGGVVSCFADYEGNTYAVKINADGSFPWGEEGIQLFDGQGFSRTEMVAGTDGGFWALGTDYNNSYLQYVNADGTLNPTNTISTSGKSCIFGQLTLGNDNNVFLTYEQLGSGFYTDKTIHVIGFQPDGFQITQDVELMAPQTFQSTYVHHALADGLGGGYVYIWHPAFNEAFNVYVFHYDADGNSTIDDPNGVSVHSPNPNYFYLDAYATVDPLSHDLIIAYRQTDAATQTESKLFINRITAHGERFWDEGVQIYGNSNTTIHSLTADAFPDESGIAITYAYSYLGSNASMIEAVGYDREGHFLWSTIMSSVFTARNPCENSSGFHHGQNIIAWTNADGGGIYGQNIHPDGILGIATPPLLCPGPENFQGEYHYDMEAQDFGVKLSWDEPIESVEFYKIYRTDLSTNEETVIEITGNSHDYYDSAGIGSFKYQLRALYADIDCGYSLPATTPTNENYVIVEVTQVKEITDEAIQTVLNIYTMNGQLLRNASKEELSTGVYILQGLSKDGKLVHQKIYIP